MARDYRRSFGDLRETLGALREDYFLVPDTLARKKEFAEFFAKRWRRAVGPVDLVYTRTPEGRRLLCEHGFIHLQHRFKNARNG